MTYVVVSTAPDGPGIIHHPLMVAKRGSRVYRMFLMLDDGFEDHDVPGFYSLRAFAARADADAWIDADVALRETLQ